jgi:Na+/H+-dicarboxylate symporter
MLAGGVLGHDFPQLAVNLRVLALIFLRMIRTIVAPLLFATLVSGIAGHSDLKKVGRMGVKAILYYEVVTTLALIIGLVAINVSRAGVGVNLPTTSTENLQTQKLTASETILHIFPENLAKAVAEGQILQVVVFSILFGIALALVSEAYRRPMLSFTESLAETMFKFTNIVMYFAPVGVGAAIAYTVASTGMGILFNLARLLLTLYVALLVFVCGVLLRSWSASR